jgi:hypothetical protein
MKPDLEQQLEWATARDVPPNALLDQETTSLREAWLAFGQLLAAAQPAPDQPLKCLSDPPGRGRRWWPLAAIAGLAASLLVAATIFWSARRTGPAPVITAPSVEVAVSRAEPSAPAAKKVPREKPSSPAAPGSTLTWDDALDKEITVAGQAVVSTDDDPLDEAIAVLGQAVVSADQESPLLAGASVPVRYGLEEIEKDMKNNPL